MISFSGMAKFFGWPERLPLVAPEHRPEMLQTMRAKERVLPFAEAEISCIQPKCKKKGGVIQESIINHACLRHEPFK